MCSLKWQKVEVSKISQNVISEALDLHAELKTHAQLIQKHYVLCWKRLFLKFGIFHIFLKNVVQPKNLDWIDGRLNANFRHSRPSESLRYSLNLKGKIWNRIENANYFNIFNSLTFRDAERAVNRQPGFRPGNSPSRHQIIERFRAIAKSTVYFEQQQRRKIWFFISQNMSS